MKLFPGWPTASGAYRWVYLDASCGDFTAVAIFMVGAVFSPRYSVASRSGAAPSQHSAVNFALYGPPGTSLWALSEYPAARVGASGQRLSIGSSNLRVDAGGRLEAHLVERTPWWGRPLEAVITLEAEAPGHESLQLVQGEPHWWQPLAPRARARLQVTSGDLELDLTGRGYLDSNHGDEPLGGGVPGWRWTRIHGEHQTRVVYEPPGVEAIELVARDGATNAWRSPASSAATTHTRWGLEVPSSLDTIATAALSPPRRLESSPFYARLEARNARTHALCEVADFRAFHQPHIRWMAHWRTRLGPTPVTAELT